MKYALTVFGILTITLLNAQKNNLPQWHFGVKGDLNLYNISGSGTASGYTAGISGGVYAERTFNNKWSIQPELTFSQNNTKQENFQTYYPDVYNPYGANDIKLAYISVPVMVKYNVTEEFSFLAGPQYNFMVTDAESLLSPPRVDKAFKKSVFGAAAGAQYNAGRVSIYGRYTQDISNINNIDSRYSWRASHIQLGIAVRVL